MTKMTKNGTDVGELCRQSWMVILKSAPHKANFENDIPHHRDCQWSTIGRDWNWIKRKLFLLLWSPSFLLLLSNCCNKDTVGCNVQCDVCWVSQSLILSSCGNFLRIVRYRVSKKGTALEYLTPKVMINRSMLQFTVVMYYAVWSKKTWILSSNKGFKPRYWNYEIWIKISRQVLFG